MKMGYREMLYRTNARGKNFLLSIVLTIAAVVTI
jgi:hypothetical protein